MLICNYKHIYFCLFTYFMYLLNTNVINALLIVINECLKSNVLCCRFVLAVGSAVFDAMFNGGMATTSTEIELPDVEPAAFLSLLKYDIFCSFSACMCNTFQKYADHVFPLRFLYSDEVHIGPETVMTTLYTAKKYAVPALEAHCVEFLKKNLRADNAFMLLTQVCLIRRVFVTLQIVQIEIVS